MAMMAVTGDWWAVKGLHLCMGAGVAAVCSEQCSVPTTLHCTFSNVGPAAPVRIPSA